MKPSNTEFTASVRPLPEAANNGSCGRSGWLRTRKLEFRSRMNPVLVNDLDLRVVDAYWIGNRLSDRVDPGLMTKSIDVHPSSYCS